MKKIEEIVEGKIELKPCPCGAPAEIQQKDCPQYSGFIITCSRFLFCKSGSFKNYPFKYLQTAVDNWNSGVSMPAQHYPNATPKLKPCPFCGGEAVISRNDLSKNNHPSSFFKYPNVVFHSAGCPACGISFSSENEQEAVSKWNSRWGMK